MFWLLIINPKLLSAKVNFYGIKECIVSLVAAILGKSWEEFIDDSILEVITVLILTLIYECFHLLHG